MDQQKRGDVQELMEEVAKELGDEWGNRDQLRQSKTEQKQSMKKSWTPVIVLIGAIIVLSFVIQWAARSRSNTQYKALAEKLNGLESRVMALENKPQKSPDLLARINKLESQVGGLETSITSLSRRVDKLSEQSRVHEAKRASLKPVSKAARTYIIRRGDTLFGIAKRFGIKATSICRANNLTLKSVLHPGQKIIISAK